MAQSHLRIFYGPEESTTQTLKNQSLANQPNDSQQVTLPMEDVLPLLADAVQSQRTWLRDFASDEITISSDLYEVLLAYQHFRRPGA